MSKPIIRVMTGLPGSGKTTVARGLPGLRVNLDDIRTMMGWTSQADWSKEKEAVAIETMLSAIEAAVDEGHDVVVDNTHLSPRLPGLMRRRVGGRASFEVVSLRDVPVEECIERDAARERSVGEAAIRKMNKGKFQLTDEFLNIWPEIVPVEGRVKEVPEVIIVDLDGTLAIHNGRDPFDASRCEEDEVDSAVSAIVVDWFAAMYECDYMDYKLILMSGRDEKFRPQTENWLRNVWGCTKSSDLKWDLYMRPEGDTRPDFLVKHELFEEHVRGKYNVLFCLDDRDQVIRLWRELGLKALQVCYGNF